MKKMIIGAAVFASALVVLRRFGPEIREGAMKKCHQMMSKCQEMFGQQAGSPTDAACMSAAMPGAEKAAAGEHGPAEAARVI